jgi:hypothetical protein
MNKTNGIVHAISSEIKIYICTHYFMPGKIQKQIIVAKIYSYVHVMG